MVFLQKRIFYKDAIFCWQRIMEDVFRWKAAAGQNHRNGTEGAGLKEGILRIDSSRIGMESARSYSSVTFQSSTFRRQSGSLSLAGGGTGFLLIASSWAPWTLDKK